ncbi:hypothetical protein GQ600_12920 [Phytophthora cactorum]|nr:hypothetical protein GQ600_12920 [Phytophthora cactorum]
MTGMTHRPNTARTLECILGLLAGLVVVWVVECGYPELEISSVITPHQSQLASRRDGYSGNTVAFKFRVKKTLADGATVSVLKRGRFRGNNRVVIVWKIFSEGEGIFSGMDANETTWARIRPYLAGSNTGTYSRAAYSDTAITQPLKRVVPSCRTRLSRTQASSCEMIPTLNCSLDAVR